MYVLSASKGEVGLIVGTVVGTVILVTLIILVALFCYRYKKRAAEKRREEKNRVDQCTNHSNGSYRKENQETAM